MLAFDGCWRGLLWWINIWGQVLQSSPVIPNHCVMTHFVQMIHYKQCICDHLSMPVRYCDRRINKNALPLPAHIQTKEWRSCVQLNRLRLDHYFRRTVLSCFWRRAMRFFFPNVKYVPLGLGKKLRVGVHSAVSSSNRQQWCLGIWV